MTPKEVALLLELVRTQAKAIAVLTKSRDEWKAVALRAVDVTDEAVQALSQTAPDEVRGKETRMA